MIESFIHSTDNNNSYLYDTQHALSMLLHPELTMIHEKSINADPYYIKKYDYLKSHGFFGASEPVDFETTLDESIIKRNIIQLRQVVFETTDHCNLSCPYCSLGEMYELGKKDKKNIDTQAAVTLLKYIFDLKPENTQLMIGFFGGEPLVNFKFIEEIIHIVNHLNVEKKLKIIYNMTTNATLIHKHIDFLVEHKFKLLISLDGDEKGQSYRVFANNNKSSFQKVIRNVDMIQREYPEYFENEVSFNAVLHNNNSVENIYEFIYKRYNKIPNISQLNTEDINPDKKELFEKIFHSKRKSEEAYQETGSDILPKVNQKRESYREFRKFLHSYSVNYYITNLLHLLYDKINPVPTGTCLPFSRKMFLNTSNGLLPCEKVSHKYHLGKVDGHVIIDIDEIVRKHKFYYNQIKETCQYCYDRKFCPTCMLTINNLDRLETEEFVCYDFQDQDFFKKKASRILSFLEINPREFSHVFDEKMIEQ